MNDERSFWRVVLLFICFGFAVILAMASYAKAQYHEHGVTVPDWYDQDCCNRNDCRPVADEDVNFELTSDKPMVSYTHDGVKLLYEKSRWRKSKDERYHACFKGSIVYCIYIPTAV